MRSKSVEESESRLLDVLAAVEPLDPLSPQRYATAHAVWEAASDQRSMIRQWLAATVPALTKDVGSRPVEVLGVGVGDGSVDAVVARALTEVHEHVRYRGVEPHQPSLDRFVDALHVLNRAGLEVEAILGTFDDVDPDIRADVVCFVHSIYYVPDLAVAVDRAVAMLRPGGSIVVLTSPRRPLNVPAAAVTARTGDAQWFAEDVIDAAAGSGLDMHAEIIDASVDLSAIADDPDGTGRELLDFLIQARSSDMDPALLEAILTYLDAIAPEDGPVRHPHPVEALVIRNSIGASRPASA
jgi:SAM-dependent methyltransferase